MYKMAHVSFSRAINNREIILVFIDKGFLFLLERIQKIKILKNEYVFDYKYFSNDNNQCTQNGPRILFSCNNNREIILVFIDKDFLFFLERVKIL